MKRALLLVAALLVGLVAVLWVRSLGGGPASVPSEPPTPLAFDHDAAVERFAAALRFQTISHGRDSGVERDDEAFLALHRHLEQSYPRAHAALERETVGGLSLLYTWRGTDPALAPMLLMGHQDVVPVDPAALERWTHPPYDGVVADGFLWGRGAIDDKINVIGQLEAVEALLAEGFAPRRTVMLFFGHDEELGGGEGAVAAAALLGERGVRPLLVVDEGGAVATGGVIPGLDRPLAAIGVAEKGYVSLELLVETEGGHSSMPPESTAIGIVSTAIHRLEREQMPSHFDGPFRRTLEAVGPHMGGGASVAAANLWLLAPLVERMLLSSPTTAAMIRTTTAPTIFHAGVKDNALPNEARAVVNFRVYPGDSIDDVVAHAIRIVDDERVQITPRTKRREPSGVTELDTPAWELLTKTIAQVYPDAVVAPFLIPGGTDARYFREVSDGVFGFIPVRADVGDVRRAHGNDERIALDSFFEGVRFYAQIIRNAQESDQAPSGR